MMCRNGEDGVECTSGSIASAGGEICSHNGELVAVTGYTAPSGAHRVMITIDIDTILAPVT